MPTNAHHVLVCIEVVDVDALETGVVDQAAVEQASNRRRT
jgi:hypothetical protein